MIIVRKKDMVNNFKEVPIPSARKLFERYGYSLTRDGHPDNTDPYHFSEPSNLVGSTELEKMSVVGAGVVRGAYAAQAAQKDEVDESSEVIQASGDDARKPE